MSESERAAGPVLEGVVILTDNQCTLIDQHFALCILSGYDLISQSSAHTGRHWSAPTTSINRATTTTHSPTSSYSHCNQSTKIAFSLPYSLFTFQVPLLYSHRSILKGLVRGTNLCCRYLIYWGMVCTKKNTVLAHAHYQSSNSCKQLVLSVWSDVPVALLC